MVNKSEETDFEKKYIAKINDPPNHQSGKIVISDEAYALGELLEKIFIQLFRGNRNG